MAQVLVIGGGGREQALAWKLAQSDQVEKVYVAPGNAGSRDKVESVAIGFLDITELLRFASEKKIDLTVVGQEAAAEAGVVDAFREAGLAIFGPTKAAVRIESSKVMAKDLMAAQRIPTAAYQAFSDAHEALVYAHSRPLPVVIKADGLAEGKGVSVCTTSEEIEEAIDRVMIKRDFGDSGNQVVVEDFLRGQEVSTHALSDGHAAVLFPASQDHKQVYDGDQGPNTGGMGVIAPVSWVTSQHLQYVSEKIVAPALRGLAAAEATFTGCIYPGLMIDGNDVRVVEFNARFGDPEAEVYMRLLQSDLYELLLACATDRLVPEAVRWHDGFAVGIALASGGYPGKYKKGLPITGIDEAETDPDVVVFHAGTMHQEGKLVTAGGRVLLVTATGSSLDAVLGKAYAAIKKIHFEGMHYRTDIGRRPAPH